MRIASLAQDDDLGVWVTFGLVVGVKASGHTLGRMHECISEDTLMSEFAIPRREKRTQTDDIRRARGLAAKQKEKT
jgi:hypothetical protein